MYMSRMSECMSELLLDFDSDKDYEEYKTRLKYAKKKLKFKHRSRVYKTQHGYHVYLTVDMSLTDLEKLFFQTYLNDDFRRAIHNYIRVKNDIKDWNVLFEKKYYYTNDTGVVCVSKEVRI